MKCPKCHKEVEKGSLYCPTALRRYSLGKRIQHSGNSDEKGAAEPPIRKKQKTEIIKYFKHPKEES